ncbi:hypothetical protein [Providencia phage PSTRCR_127]|nr:hypothetical protein [Providencia phage PSTRCR_127]UGO50157.1 hypothetical protein RGZ1_126 [Morganella phage vB_MmoM_Rgz1]
MNFNTLTTQFAHIITAQNVKEACYIEFAKIDMYDKAAVRDLVDNLVDLCGLSKRSVQSYVSSYRRGIKAAQANS